MNRREVLDRAAECVLRDRNATHGSPENTFGTIAALWSAYLGTAVTAADAAALLALLKIARIKANPAHDDNWIDLAGYAACGAEVVAKPVVIYPSIEAAQ